MADIYAQVKLDLAKEEEGKLRKKIGNIDTSQAGKKVATRFGVGFNGAIGSIISRSAGIFAAGFAAVKVGGFLKDAISQASDLGETTSKVQQIFGPAAKDIQAFSKTSARALGQTQQAALDANATFGIFGKSAGLKGTALTGFTTKLTTLAGDLASFNNTSPEQAIEAIGAALRGESEPIRAYGVLLDDASLRQEALKQGLIKTTKQALTPQQKVLAAQALILKQTGTAQGDFARTSGGMANQQRILSAQFANLKTTIGAVALPLVTKLFGFLNDKAMPVLTTVAGGVTAFGSAFKHSGDGITSSGFAGFMERLGIAAAGAFAVFQTQVIPRLKEFGGFLRDQVLPVVVQFVGFVVSRVIPAVVGFGGNLAGSLGPAVRDVFAFFKAEVLPRLKDFAGFLGSSVLPKIGAMATSLSKNKDFLVPFAATILTLVGALKIWAIVQAILNAELLANPIGLVVVAIAALVAGLVWAYKNSEIFRNIVNGVFNAVKVTAVAVFKAVVGAVSTAIGWIKSHWPLILAILTGPIGVAVLVISKHWTALKTGARDALAYVVDKFLGFVGTLITGAAKAFGWIPKIGGPLRNAATDFQKFRNSVNRSLGGINDQTVNVAIKYSSKGVNLSTPSSVGRFAGGGKIRGVGSPTSDRVPILASPTEWVIKGKSSAKYGDYAMASVNAGTATIIPRGFAAGGRPGLTIRPAAPPATLLSKEIAAHALRGAGPYIRAGAKQLAASGAAGPPGSVLNYRGVRLNQRTIRMLLNAERFLGAVFHIMQGSYSTRVAASGGTHAGGGAMDTNGPRGWNTAVAALRQAGFAAWHRTPAQGPWGHHIHSIALGDPTASPSAKAQMAAYRRGGDGLGHGMWRGGKVGDFLSQAGITRYDRGGQWPNNTLGVNTSGKTETVVPGGVPIDLSDDSIRALGKEFVKGLGEGKFRLVQDPRGGAYILQNSNG